MDIASECEGRKDLNAAAVINATTVSAIKNEVFIKTGLVELYPFLSNLKGQKGITSLLTLLRYLSDTSWQTP